VTAVDEIAGADRMEIITIQCQTAAEFLDWLSSHGRYENEWASWGPAIFRGQSQDDWPLVPSALRPTRLIPVGDSWGLAETERIQILGELALLERFIAAADEHGFDVPGDSLATRKLIAKLQRIGNRFDATQVMDAWPPDELLPALALAQHHKVPTRLLDWSFDPYVPAYFAAEGAARKVHKFDEDKASQVRFAVNCCKELTFRGFEILNQFAGQVDLRYAGHRLIRLPYTGNRNLRAQRGVFTVSIKDHVRLDDEVDRNGCETKLVDKDDSFETGSFPRCELFRLTLSYKEAPALLKALARIGYTAARIYPGLDGVAASILEPALWS
jgi:hypothetical protein